MTQETEQPVVAILTTADNRETLQRIARELVERRLAACVQISGPVTSIYRWDDQVEQAEEWRCQVKSVERHAEVIVRCIRQLHEYDTPQVIVLPVTGGCQEYLGWLRDQVCR